MDDAAKRYLEELRRNLNPLPEDERSDAVREIESHIAEGQAHGRPTASVLAGLGDAIAAVFIKHQCELRTSVLARLRRNRPHASDADPDHHQHGGCGRP